MRPADTQPSIYRYQVSLPKRAAIVALALGFSLLIIFMLIRMSALSGFPIGKGSRTTLINLLTSTPAAEKKAQEKKQEKQTTPAKQLKVPKPIVPPILAEGNRPLEMIVLSSEDYAASDISKLGSRKTGSESQSADAGSAGGDSDPSIGRGPNGEPLYNAEWYRKPTRAELATYLPANRPPEGWAIIACRTAEKYRVEDCQELGDSPPGSGLARAVRQAAWQFLVRPPRKGGKALVGVWVRILYEFSVEPDKQGS